QLVAAAIGPIAAENGRADQGEITDRIERLVAHELIVETKTFRIDDAIIANDHGIFQRCAEGQPAGPQALDVGQEAEGAGASEIAAEAVGIDVGGVPLPADDRRGEVDLDLDPHAVVGPKLGEGIAELDAHWLQDLQEMARLPERGDADLIEGADEI